MNRICSIWRKPDAVILSFTMVVYGVNRFLLKKFIGDIPILEDIIKYHFNDYCGAIVFLAYVNLLLSHSRYKGAEVRSLPAVLVSVAVMSVCWEAFAPCFLERSTGDWLDCLAYLLGGFTYWFIYKRYYVMSEHDESKQREKNV